MNREKLKEGFDFPENLAQVNAARVDFQALKKRVDDYDLVCMAVEAADALSRVKNICALRLSWHGIVGVILTYDEVVSKDWIARELPGVVVAEDKVLLRDAINEWRVALMSEFGKKNDQSVDASLKFKFASAAIEKWNKVVPQERKRKGSSRYFRAGRMC